MGDVVYLKDKYGVQEQFKEIVENIEGVENNWVKVK